MNIMLYINSKIVDEDTASVVYDVYNLEWVT